MRAFALVGKSREVAVVLGDVTDLSPRLADDLAGVPGLELGELACMSLEKLSKAVEQLAALRRCEACPGWIAERAMRCVHSLVDVRRGRSWHRRPGPAIRRVDALEGLGAGDKGAVDVSRKALERHRCLSRFAHVKAGITSRMKSSSERFL